jgi:guanine deaminase
MSKPKIEFMREAIRLSIESAQTNGGPFGAVIVKDGKIIAGSANSVTIDNDPTAHAEVNAIRKAAKILNTYDLSGCEIYTSCEPCPMCFGAIYWAHIDTIYYGNTKQDAREVGFDDAFIYEELDTPENMRKIKAIPFLREEAIVSFEIWDKKEDKIKY